MTRLQMCLSKERKKSRHAERKCVKALAVGLKENEDLFGFFLKRPLINYSLETKKKAQVEQSLFLTKSRFDA